LFIGVLLYVFGGMTMEYAMPEGGCMCPEPPSCIYLAGFEGSEGRALTYLELIRKEKNVFGDMVYLIREERGSITSVYERNLEEYLREKGVSHLVEGKPFVYPIKK